MKLFSFFFFVVSFEFPQKEHRLSPGFFSFQWTFRLVVAEYVQYPFDAFEVCIGNLFHGTKLNRVEVNFLFYSDFDFAETEPAGFEFLEEFSCGDASGRLVF